MLRTVKERSVNLYVNDSNRNIFYSDPDERLEDISNRSMQLGHPRRAMAEEPLRSAVHHPATARDPTQRVNDRIADLGNEATARRSGGQGVYPSYYNNDYQLNVDNHHMSQPNFNSQMQYFHGNHSQGEFPSEPMRRISSGRDRTGNDGIARLFVPWPNEHCLIGIDRRKCKYDQLNQAQWQAGLMNILAMERDPLCRKTMLNHITRLSQDVVDCGFRVAKGAHAAVLIALEEGRVSWMEPEAIEGIRTRQYLSDILRSRGPLVAHHSHRGRLPSHSLNPRAPRRPTVYVSIIIRTHVLQMVIM